MTLLSKLLCMYPQSVVVIICVECDYNCHILLSAMCVCYNCCGLDVQHRVFKYILMLPNCVSDHCCVGPCFVQYSFAAFARQAYQHVNCSCGCSTSKHM